MTQLHQGLIPTRELSMAHLERTSLASLVPRAAAPTTAQAVPTKVNSVVNTVCQFVTQSH